MRVSPQFAGSVGGRPGIAMLVPLPSVTSTCRPAAVTRTRPRTTKTPNTPALGPAKKRVPLTAINANGERTEMSRPFCVFTVEQHGAALKFQDASSIDDEAVHPHACFGTKLDLCRRSEPQRQSRPSSGSRRDRRRTRLKLAARSRLTAALSANPSPVSVSTDPAAAAAPKTRGRERGRLPALPEKHVGS